LKILDQVIRFYENRMPSIARYLSEVILVSMLWGYYAFGFFYRQFLSHETKLFLLALLVIYAVIILPYNFLIKKNTTLFFRSQLVILVALRSLQSIWAVSRGKMAGKILQNESERFALLFFIVKVVFIPAMTKYLVDYSILLYQTVVSENFNWQSILSNYQWFFLLSMIVVIVNNFRIAGHFYIMRSSIRNRSFP
jgi:hypothetical protein